MEKNSRKKMWPKSARVAAAKKRGIASSWVNVRDAAQKKSAIEVLSAHAARDVHTHELVV